MKVQTIVAMIPLMLAASAYASNNLSFVNGKYIDENSSWSEIQTTAGYEVADPVTYGLADGSTVKGMNTCLSNGKLMAQVATPDFSNGAEGGVTYSYSYVEVPATYPVAHCVPATGENACQSVSYETKSQNLLTSYSVPVLAIENQGGEGPTQYWGVAFEKTFQVPQCSGAASK